MYVSAQMIMEEKWNMFTSGFETLVPSCTVSEVHWSVVRNITLTYIATCTSAIQQDCLTMDLLHPTLITNQRKSTNEVNYFSDYTGYSIKGFRRRS